MTLIRGRAPAPSTRSMNSATACMVVPSFFRSIGAGPHAIRRGDYAVVCSRLATPRPIPATDTVTDGHTALRPDHARQNMDDGRITDATSSSLCGTPHAHAESRPTAPATTRGEPSAGRPQDCPLCGSDLVYPTDWRQVDASGWDLELRCPECHTVRTVCLSREDDARFQPASLPERGGADPRGRGADAPVRRRRRGVLQRPGSRLERGDLILPMDF